MGTQLKFPSKTVQVACRNGVVYLYFGTESGEGLVENTAKATIFGKDNKIFVGYLVTQGLAEVGEYRFSRLVDANGYHFGYKLTHIKNSKRTLNLQKSSVELPQEIGELPWDVVDSIHERVKARLVRDKLPYMKYKLLQEGRKLGKRGWVNPRSTG